MITSTRAARTLFASVTVFTALLSTTPLAPWPKPPSTSSAPCQLERIGTQYVLCDNLTGLGARAPEWVPEQR